MKTKTIKLKIKEPKQRLDVFLTEKLEITRSQVRKIFKEKRIIINNIEAKKIGEIVRAGDIIKILPEKKINLKKINIRKKDISIPKIKIIKETDDYLVVEKPWGLLTHSLPRKDETSLAEILSKKYPEINKVGDSPEQRPGIIHRLDKEASGLIAVARTQKMFNHLKKQFKQQTIHKTYIVLVHGKIDKFHDEINFPIARSKITERMSAHPKIEKGLPTDFGKEAFTEFNVIKRFVNFTLLKVKIHTGRTHQIRVHLFAYNHPVVGDPLYFTKKQKRITEDRLNRLFLHSSELSFVDLQKQTQTFKIDLPNKLKSFLKTIT